MNKRTLLTISGLWMLSLATFVGFAGCGVEDDESGDDGSSGGSATGGASTTGGSGAEPGGSAGAGNENVAGFVCDHDQSATNGRITDFSEFEEGASWSDGSGPEWGNDESLTGGTHSYSAGTGLTATVTGGALHLTGTVPAGDYAGIVFWFGPCYDASIFQGVSLNLSGSVTDAKLYIQVQQAKNYPIDEANEKGQCEFSSEETKWDECKYAQVEVEIPEDGGVLEYAWADFTGGLPETTLASNELLGVQIHIQECAPSEDGAGGAGGATAAATGCPVDLTIDDLMFY